MKTPLILSTVAATAGVFYFAVQSAPTAQDPSIAENAAQELAALQTQFNTERATLTEQTAALNAQIAEIEGAGQGQQDALDAAIAQRDKLTADLDEATQKLAALTDENATLVADKETLTADMATLQSNMDTLSATSGDASTELTALTDQIATGQQELETLQAAMADMQAEQGMLNETIATLEADAAAATETIAALESERDTLIETVANLESVSASDADTIAALETEKSELAETVATLEQSATTAAAVPDTQIAELEALVAEKTEAAEAATANATDLGEKAAAFAAEITTLQAALTARDTEIEQLGAASPAQACQDQTDAALADGAVSFANGTPVLDDAAGTTLDAIAAIALACADQGLTLEIEGHTDGSGGEATNLLLSNGRAKAVETYLTNAGVPANAIRSVGFGGNYPIADADPAQNQRIVFDWE